MQKTRLHELQWWVLNNHNWQRQRCHSKLFCLFFYDYAVYGIPIFLEYCKEFKNFNSMFAILSGLNTGTVSRLHNTWEKLPSKYQKMFDDLMFFLDPTRNMSKYRNLLNGASSTPPVVSFCYMRCVDEVRISNTIITYLALHCKQRHAFTCEVGSITPKLSILLF